MLDGPLPADFQQVETADHIGGDIGVRMLQRVAHAGLGRQMDDDIRLFFLDHTPDGRHIADIDDMGSEAVRRASRACRFSFRRTS